MVLLKTKVQYPPAPNKNIIVKTWFYILFNRRTRRFFFGQSKYSRKDQRHTDDVYTKLLGDWSYDGYDVHWIGISQEGFHLDHQIHDKFRITPHCQYNKSGKGSNEIFLFEDYTFNQVVDLSEKYVKEVFGEVLERKNLKLRPHQEKFVKKILSSWEEWVEFLCFVKCRGGKSIMTLSTIVEAGVKETLIVSRFNSPKQSWFDDCRKFEQFKNVRVIKLNEDKWVEEYKKWADDPDIHIIFWSTVQGLCASGNKRVNKLVKLSSIEFIVFDECHIGEDAKEFKTVRDKFPDAKCLKVSGTAYDQVWKYPKEHRFVYSYEDEQHYYPGKYPRMNVHTIKVDVSGYREIFGDDPDAFTNIFLTNDDETAFLYPDLVRNFWNKYFTVLGQRHLRHNERIIINRNHIIASLPSVAACRLSVPFISEYAALDVTSKTKEDSDTINTFVKENVKTICLTVEANILGVTCEEWDCVVHLYKGKDIKRWIQTSARGGSGEHDWDVVEFAPRRALTCLQDSLTLAKVENPELLDSEIVDFTNVFEWDEGHTQLSQDKVFDLLAIDVKEDVQRSFKNLSRSISNERLNQEDLNTVDTPSASNPQDENIVNDNETNDEGAKKSTGRDNNLKEKSTNRKKLEQVLNSIPLVLVHATKTGKPIRTTDELFESEFYEPITQDTQSVVYNLLKSRDISARDITTIIHQNNPIIDKSVHKDFTKTIDSFRISKKNQQTTPLELLRDICENILITSTDKILVVCDPNGVVCSYLIEHLKLSASNIWVWENHSTHKSLIKFIHLGINIVNDLEDLTMKFDVAISNPPYQRENKTGKKGKGGNNTLYIDMVSTTIDVVKDGGYIAQITPAAGLLKSTVYGKSSVLLNKVMNEGCLLKIDLTTKKKYFSHVGSTICNWFFVKGVKQGKVEIHTQEGTFFDNIENLYYVGVGADKPYKRIEHQLYRKIISNQDGEILEVKRGKKAYTKECTFYRFGYPKIQFGLDPENDDPLGFDGEFYEFMTSKLGLWLLDYVSRHDVMIYHNLLTGIRVPKDGFDLTDEENNFINSGKWLNFSSKDA